MPISLVQQGLIVQDEFAKFVMMGSGGLIELAPPLTDDERRDYELHVRGHFGFAIAIQVKSTMRVQRKGRVSPLLHCFFQVKPAKRLVTSPLFYYFIAYLDPKTMRLADPVFLIPSKTFHKYASPKKHGDAWQFTFMGSMAPDSHDRWARYRVNTLDLGQRLLEIMRELNGRGGLHRERSKILRIDGSLIVRPLNRQHRTGRATRAKAA